MENKEKETHTTDRNPNINNKDHHVGQLTKQAPRLLVEFIRVFFGVDVLTQTKGGDYKRDVHHIGRGEVVDSGLQ